MAHARGADFMFCDLCGTMMFLYSKEHVECPLCKFKKSAKDLSEREISYQVSSEDMRRDLGISHFEGKMEVKDMEINKTCEKCGHTKLKFSTRQMLKLPRLIYIELSNLGNERGGIHNQGLVGSQPCSVNSLDLGFRVV
ncbi:hypothetical protein DKX38_019286 [Salix brachista]|uniref:Uncharacterized protein n=1 Tax=Salix brachista TaxID=2182728 RepID=A0A5N5KFU5_9ROSI|nr:hypothetical protein DKX38_019286 [Salix brachista]